MAAELDKEAKQDSELYDKLACWCETNDKDKTKAISDANDAIASLTASIEKNTALASTRETERRVQPDRKRSYPVDPLSEERSDAAR